jgi:oligopeptide/dipeptide ABC transporter ATP-binding protein
LTEAHVSVLLEARRASKHFGRARDATVALDNFSLQIDADVPSFTAIAGESGSGKTTLARLLLGFAQPTSGEILYRGKKLSTLSGSGWAEFRREVQAIFQDPFEVFNPFYKVDHLLSVAIAKFHLAGSRADARDRMQQALDAVGLRPEETLGRYPHQLSGGQRQRLTIARALLLRPRLIIADEPVSMVDASLRATILDTLRHLHSDYGISFLYITHDLTTAYQMSRNIIVLYRGSVAEVGDVDLVIKQPKHPYSQLLISSIPEPDVSDRWDDVAPPAVAFETGGAARRGCAFADRCPFVMGQCRNVAPPLYRLDEQRAAACFLYQQSQALGADELNRVLLLSP